MLQVIAIALDVPLAMLERLRSGADPIAAGEVDGGQPGGLLDRLWAVLAVQRRDEDVYGPRPIYRSAPSGR